MELFHGGLKVGGPIALATVRDWLQDRIGLSPAVQMHLLVTIIVIAGLWIIERVVLAIVYRRATDPWSRYRWRKTITYITLAIAALVIGREWLDGFKMIATSLRLGPTAIPRPLLTPPTNPAGWGIILAPPASPTAGDRHMSN